MAKKGKKEKGVKTEAQLLKEEEARRKLMEETKAKAKEKQLVEEKNSKLNALKIQSRWREIMKHVKVQALQAQVEALQQIHERHMDRKNAATIALEKDLGEAEQQFGTALQAHCINTDTLIDLQLGRLNTLQNQFGSELGLLEAEFHTERAKLQTQSALEKAEILGIITRMEQEFQETEADAKHEYSSQKDDIKNKNLEEKHALRIQLEGTVEDLWRQFQAALNQYNSSTEERKRQFEDLKQKDQKNAKEIEQQMKRLIKLQETIAHFKAKLSNNSKEYEERNKTLREEKEAIQAHFQALKRRMNNFRKSEHKRLTDLTLLSSKVLKDLSVKVEKAEMIIKLAEMNRKLETEKEKEFNMPANDPELAEILPKEFPAMEQFNKRFNKISLDVLALKKQKEGLQEENANLRSILRQYLDGISLNEDVLNQLNPLVVVNGRTNAPLKSSNAPLNITYVEVSHQHKSELM
ncbi:coiled-coil domain-containing protein 65-like protein [Obelidium mucronatum]|nr:coiled-coil domain-containing protein 65-like protein [Obelidium mucronatum]